MVVFSKDARLINCHAVPALLEARGRDPITVFAVKRWIHKGINGCKLSAIRCGNSLYTTEEALAEFFAAISPA